MDKKVPLNFESQADPDSEFKLSIRTEFALAVVYALCVLLLLIDW